MKTLLSTFLPAILMSYLWLCRLVWLNLFLIVLFAAQVAYPQFLFEDSILLKGTGKEIRAKVTELMPDHVTAIVSKGEVTSVNYCMEDKEGYFDKVSFGSEEVSCRVMDLGVGTMVLEIPREEIASVKVFFQREEEMGSLPSDVSSLSNSGVSNGTSSLQELKDRLKKELKEELSAEKKKEEKVTVKQSTGRVEGKITRGGNPLPGCKVKIVQMVEKGFLFKAYSSQDSALEFETETDEEGRYIFQDIPEGDYKLYWKPPREDGWIRRLKMEPDVFVLAGQTYHSKDVDTSRLTVN